MAKLHASMIVCMIDVEDNHLHADVHGVHYLKLCTYWNLQLIAAIWFIYIHIAILCNHNNTIMLNHVYVPGSLHACIS